MSNLIRQRRRELLLTQRALAKRAGIAVRTLHAVENGASCHMTTRRKLLKALGIPFERHAELWPRADAPTLPTPEPTDG